MAAHLCPLPMPMCPNLPTALLQGRPPVFVDMRIVDDNGRELPHDGKAAGDLQVRGPHTISRYYGVRLCSSRSMHHHGLQVCCCVDCPRRVWPMLL